MSMVICEHCDGPIDSDDDPGCFVDHEGWCKDEIICEPCRERAYDQGQESLMEDGGGPSLIEQQRQAWNIKHGVRS
jgi:hypothetical protein